MRSKQASLEALEKVAEALQVMCQEVAFVGGATLALFIDDPAAPDVRATDDVDCVVEATSLLEMHKVEERLRRLGFEHHPDEGVICRWRLQKSIIVDVMPTDGAAFGFTNRWYTEGLRHREVCALPSSGREVFVFSFPYFFASKLEAFAKRGGDAWDSSKDFEDIVAVLDGRLRALDQLTAAPANVRTYVRDEARRLLLQPNKLREAIEAHLLPAREYQDRAPRIYQALQALAAARTPEMLLAEMGVPTTHWSRMKIRLYKVTPMGSATFSVAAESARELANNPKYGAEITWREKTGRVAGGDYDYQILLTPEECWALRSWLRGHGFTLEDNTDMGG